ncbi:T6SS protein Cts1T [Enterobacillus tribolii]|uniref:Uncharacterized protein n=1 Tax=Enterobacillus tribolii TaxID=1487935 RepID=A0A370R2B5_9GAMM|nr:T6SS protein Cts1T [Enterobacillus tribolii]MBW7984870.1 T6SS protein Cts1T [Enterobacillus tribolii]RDK96062.1 hypothetical protein C8D90_102549 [Enterobacillus tribolii]
MAIRILLLKDNAGSGLFRLGGLRGRRIRTFIKNRVLPGMHDALPGKSLPKNYPWCFILPPASLRRKTYYIGAFVPFDNARGERSFIALYSAVSYKWLQSNLALEFPAAFWMARILAGMKHEEITSGNYVYVRPWIKALQRSFSWFWESIALTENFRFRNRSKFLLRECTDLDYEICGDDGVDIMPWKNWPECIQAGDCVWLWRQSRHNRLIESQRILLKHDEGREV